MLASRCFNSIRKIDCQFETHLTLFSIHVLIPSQSTGKSGVMFPVPDVVKEGTYGGSAGWGAKKDGKKK